MECEICGAETDTLYEIEIEGATMLVCAVCAKGKHLTGRVISEKQKTEEEAKPSAPSMRAEGLGEGEEELIDNFGEVIRKARERLGLPLKVLAEKINEKESTLLRVEEQKMQPNDKLIKKLEKELGIKLTRQVVERKTYAPSSSMPLSLWDAATKKEKK